MINVYSPTVQQIYGVPPGTMPTYLNIMSSPAQQQEGLMPTPQIQQTAYNYGPTMGNPSYYQQQRDMAANNLRQELINPINDYSGGYGYNNGYGTYFQQQNAQFTVQEVQGFNPLGVDEIQSATFEDRMSKLNNFFNDAVNDSRDKFGQYQNQYNYYGYYNTFGVDQNIINQYYDAKKDLEAEAKQNRIDLNKRISKAAHTYLGDYDEEFVNSIYDDRKVEVNNIAAAPGYNEAMALSRLVDITEARKKQVRDAHDAVTKRHNKFINPNDNIGELFDHAGLMLWQERFDAEEIKRRNRSRFSDAEFRDFLSTQIRRREPDSSNRDAFEALMQAFPQDTAAIMNPPEGMTLLDDHTIDIRLPERLYHPEDEVYKESSTYTVSRNNEIQQEYQAQRQSFYDSIYNGSRRY